MTQVKPDACSQFFAATTPRSGKAPTDTLTALAGVARDSGYKPERLFALLDAFYPVPEGKTLRPTPFMPYLTWAPSAWVLPLKFTGGGLSAPGKVMIDSKGNAWAGDNFIVGAQNQDALWAGNLSKFAPNGRLLSPMTTGYTGGGVEGIGFGMAIDAGDKVWATTYGSRAIVRFDNDGKPLSPPEGYNFSGQFGQMQGIIVTPSGDIWPSELKKNSLSTSRTVTRQKEVCSVQSPVAVPRIIHASSLRHSISQSTSKTESGYRMPLQTGSPGSRRRIQAKWKPSRLATAAVGWLSTAKATSGSPTALATRTRVEHPSNACWRSQRPVGILIRNIDPVMVLAMMEIHSGPDGGSVTILRPDGSEALGSPVFGGGLVVPWAINVDGNDHVWVSNFANLTAGIVELCGYRTETCPAGMKMGDQISPPGGYVGGGLQLQVDVVIDPAGDVWVSNNWQDYQAGIDRVEEARSTLAAGQGLAVFYRMAKPVRAPMIDGPQYGGGFTDMTEAAFHVTAPSLRVALAAGVLAMAGCSGMMNTPTASNIAGLSPSGKVTITEDFVTGVGAGNGTLEYQGRTYPFKVVGTVAGPGGGLEKISASGPVYKLASASDFPGRYTQSTGKAGLSSSGSSDLWLENGAGVIMHLQGTSTGAMLTLGKDEIIVRMAQ